MIKKIYHPVCGRSYYYALISKRFNKEIGGKMLRIKVYMCRHCAEEFSDLDIMEHEASASPIDITEMTSEERREFINKLYSKNKDSDGKPS